MALFKQGHKINTGRIQSEEHKRHNSEAHKGKVKSKEHRKKLSESLMNHEVSQETREKIRKSHQGKKCTEEQKKKRSIASTGNKNPMYGKHFFHTEKAKEKIGEAQIGDKHWNWQNGKSFELYGFDWTDLLRHSIRTRDCFVCQICKKNGWTVHHIDYNKKNNNPDNLITLCSNCHGKTNNNRGYWIKYFAYFNIKKII